MPFFGGGGSVFSDSVFRVTGSVDSTKQLAFEVDGFTAGTTRTISVPDFNLTLAPKDSPEFTTKINIGDISAVYAELQPAQLFFYDASIPDHADATFQAKSFTFNSNGSASLGITLTNGDLSFIALGKGLRLKEGANAKQGTAVLVAGAVTVANTSVTANSRIFLTSQVDGGTPGFLRVSARVAGTSFTITSSSATDTSTVAYEIFEPA